jgi:hypothetical protein
MQEPTPPVATAPTALYQDYDGFLRACIHEYYARGWNTRRARFIALIVASGQMLSFAKDSVSGSAGARRMAIGAALVVALRIGLRYALTGPLGVVLTAATALSLGGYLVKNQKEILGRVGPYRDAIRRAREQYEEIQSGFSTARYDVAERNLMVDGLMKRFLAELDEDI